MTSSNNDDKNLSATIGATTDPNTTDDTAGTRPTDLPAPYFRNLRKDRQSASPPEDRSALVRVLSGLLHTLVQVEATQDATETSSASSSENASAVDESADYRERIASKGEYGSRAEPVDGVYGYTRYGDPVVAPTGRLAESRIDANWTPGDTLYEPDMAGAVTAATGSNANFLFVEQTGEQRTTVEIGYDRTAGPTLVDPSGERMIGVASGLESSAVRTVAASTQTGERHGQNTARGRTRSTQHDDTLLASLPPAEQARLKRLRAFDVPEQTTPEDSADGIDTAELEVLLPDGQLTPLGEVFDEPEQFARCSLESIEYSIAIEAETRKVTDGILTSRTDPDVPDGEVELIGHAKWLNNRFDEYAAARPSCAELAEARAKREAEAYRERIRPLTELDADQHAQVSEMVDRLLGEDFDRVVEIRKSRLTLAIALAKRLHRGADSTTALLRQAEAEAADPRNVQKIGNIRYMPVKSTRGRFSTQGTVSRLFENTHPEIKQAGLLQDDTGVIKFAIWKKSEWDETRPTPDPTDVGGRTLIEAHRHPELAVGDVVRCEDVIKRWYNGDPTFETRRDSTLTIVDRPLEDAATASDRVQVSR